jgi:hypothetical protein
MVRIPTRLGVDELEALLWLEALFWKIDKADNPETMKEIMKEMFKSSEMLESLKKARITLIAAKKVADARSTKK